MIRSDINSRCLYVILTLFLFSFDIVECRYKSHKFDPASYFSYYKCEGSYDSFKINSLSFRCLQCYDGNYGAYRYRAYCSRDCFKTSTYEECLQKLELPEESMENIRKDIEFITTKINFTCNGTFSTLHSPKNTMGSN